MPKKKKRVKVKLIKVKPLRGKIFNSQNLNKLKNFGKYFVFLLLLSPTTTLAQTLGVIYSNTGGLDYGIDSNSNEAIQNISCSELYNGITGELPTISSIEIPMRYADDQMPPLKPAVNVTVKIYNNYDTTQDLVYQTVHNLNTGDNGYVTFTIPEANRFICTNGFAYSVEVPQYVFFTNVDFGGVSSGVLTINGEASPFFDAKFIVNGVFPPPPPTCPEGYTGTYPECVPPPPVEEMNTAMQYGLNLILISFFLYFGYKAFSNVGFSNPVEKGKGKKTKKEKDYESDIKMTQKKYDRYYKKRHGFF